MAKETEWLDKMHDARNAISDCAFYLNGLAHAFRVTGDVVRAKRLDRVATILHTNAEIIHRGIGEKIHEQVCASEQATANMIAVVLASALKRK